MNGLFDINKVMSVYTKYKEDTNELSKTAGIPTPNTTMVALDTTAMY